MFRKLNRLTAPQTPRFPVKILQFGKGNFLRAFCDWMVDIMNEKAGFEGAVQIVQVNSQGDDENFQAQDGLYHVVLNGIRNGTLSREIRLITCVDGLVNPFQDYHRYLSSAENPELQFIISNTTEAGIRFDASHADPRTLPGTFPGKLTALLHHRYLHFQGDTARALVILPCELIERNGEALRDCILHYIAHWRLPDDFRQWVTDHNVFCNTLVDRIVPGFPKDTCDDLWKETGYEDRLMVSAEPYYSWIIEPVMSPGMSLADLRARLPLEKAGLQVKFVTDLTPYRTMKVRILNGAHTAMVPVGYLRGLRTVKEAIEDEHTGEFIRRAVEEEIIPTLDLSKEELHRFASDVFERFRNPFVRHELMSIALNSIAKYQVRVLPSVLAYKQRTEKLPERLLHALAALILFYKGDWKGQVIPLKDAAPVLDFFRQAWSTKGPAAVVEATLSNEAFWKTDLTKIDGMSASVTRHLTALMKG